MAERTVPQAVNFTREDLNAAANTALGKVGQDKAWAAAINRAVVNLASGRFSFDGHQVILHSASTDAVYHIDIKEPMTCTCRGHARGFRCWHICAARLVVRAAERHQAQLRPSRTLRPFAELQAAADALFS